ncbi:MAG: methyltransferase [Pseudolabrys sp.]|jgi:protein-S-isoprenylcysteine O-methyltransferase Ste14
MSNKRPSMPSAHRRQIPPLRSFYTARGLTRKAIGLDLFERAIVSIIYLSFVYRMSSGFSGNLNVITALLVLSETLPLVYIVLRAPSITLSQTPSDWVFAILGTLMPLMARPVVGVLPFVPLAACFGIMTTGLLLQVSAKLVLGRAFGIVAANRGIRMLGPYRFLRHPMYAGYTLTHVGFLLAAPSLTNALIYATTLTMQVIRISREERVLMQDTGYRVFATRVRYRLLPGIF